MAKFRVTFSLLLGLILFNLQQKSLALSPTPSNPFRQMSYEEVIEKLTKWDRIFNNATNPNQPLCNCQYYVYYEIIAEREWGIVGAIYHKARNGVCQKQGDFKGWYQGGFSTEINELIQWFVNYGNINPRDFHNYDVSLQRTITNTDCPPESELGAEESECPRFRIRGLPFLRARIRC